MSSTHIRVHLQTKTIMSLLVVLFSLSSWIGVVSGQYCNDQVSNGEYDNGLTDWSLYINDAGAVATMAIDNSLQLSGTNSIEVDITSVTGVEWHIQLAQPGVSLEVGKQYQFSFEAKSSVNRDISATIDSGDPNYSSYVYNIASLTASGQTFVYPFTASATQINGARIIFNLAGSQPAGNVWIDNVKLEELSATCYTPANDTILQCSGTVSPLSFDLPDAPGGSTWSILYSPSNSTPVINGSTGVLSNMNVAGQYITVLDGGLSTDTVEIAVPACDLPCVCDGASAEGYTDWSSLGTTPINGPVTNTINTSIPGHSTMTVTQIMSSGQTNMTNNNFTNTNKPAFEMLGYSGGTNQTMYVETAGNETQTIIFDFTNPIGDFDFLVYDIDEYDQVTISAKDVNGNTITDLSDWIVRSTGDATLYGQGGNNEVIAAPPIIDLANGLITSSSTTNYNRGFVALRPNILLEEITVEFTSTVGGNHVYFDFYGTLLASGCVEESQTTCLSEFNFISFGPVELNDSDIQGKACFCDTATLTNYIVAGKVPVGANEGVIYADGPFTMTNGSIQGGFVSSTSTITLNSVTNEVGNFSAPPPDTYPNQTSIPLDCAVEKNYFESLSTYYGNQTANGTFTQSAGTKYFDCNNVSGTAYFTVSLSNFNNEAAVLQNYANADAIVINFTDTDPYIYNMAFDIAFEDNSKIVIFNFPNATRLRASAVGIKGSILAPFAKLVMENGHVDGNVIVNGYTMNDGTLISGDGNAGEFHTCVNETDCTRSPLFDGDLPDIGFTGCQFHSEADSYCVGDAIQLSPSADVTWSSSNTSVATVTNGGLVTAVGNGTASLSYNNTLTGCDSEDIPIEVLANCTPEICGNGIDDDGDGLIDSADGDCSIGCSVSVSASIEACNGGMTDVRLIIGWGGNAVGSMTITIEGVTEVIDLATVTTPHEVVLSIPASSSTFIYSTVAFTTNGGSCSGGAGLTNTCIEICDNNIDDDGDGSIDSDDPDCFDCSSGLVLNPDFSSDLNSWSNWGNTTIVTEANGNKFARVTDVGGFGQDIPASAGNTYTLSALGRMSENANFSIGLSFRDASYNNISGDFTQLVNSTNFQEYTITQVAPANTAFVTPFVWRGSGVTGNVDADGFCLTTIEELDTVTIGSIAVSNCIDQPLRDVATVSVDISWSGSSSYVGDIIVQLGDNIERLNVSSSVSSPQTVVFTMPADASTQTLTATWGASSSTTPQQVTLPAACSTNAFVCDVLYLCGLDKPYDGEAWDKGWIRYLDDINGANSVDAILTKDEAGMGTYDVMNQNTFVSVDLSAYDLIIVSGTTEGHISTDLVTALRDVSASVILGNLLLIDEMGMGATDGGVSWNTNAYIDNANSIEILDYDNGPGANGYLMTTGNYGSNATASLWAAAGDANAGTNGIIFEYDAADALPGVANQHGDRFYLGYHFNGIYANTENGGVLPSPQSSWFTPEYHLTLEGKQRLDQVLVDAGAACQPDCPVPPVAVATVPAPITCTNTTTTLSVAPNGLDYLWSTGATTQAITVSTPGAYYVTVTDVNGCTDEGVGHVVDNTAGPTVTMEGAAICTQPVELVPIVCENYGDFEAQRTLERNGWNNTIGEPGSALVGNGEFCFTIDSLKDGTLQMIGLNDDPTTSRSHTDINYAFYVWARENASAYRLYIRESGVQKSFPINSASSYVGSEFCIRRTGTTIEYLQDGVILYTSDVPSTTDLYIDNSFHSTTAAGVWYEGYSKFTNISLCGELDMAAYQWSTNETTPTITTATLGTYIVTVTDEYGCTSTASAVVSSLASDLSASIDYNGSVCFASGSQLTGVASGGSPAYTYSWSGPNGFTGSTETIAITENGNYFLTITDALGCEATTSGFVFQEYEPTIVNLQTEVCEGESVELAVSSSSAISYQWSANAGSSNSSSVTVFPTSPASTYTVTVTNDQGCTAVPEIVITANPIPTVDAGSTQTICEGDQVTLQASTPTVGQSPFSYGWSAGLGSGQSKTFIPAGSPLANVTNTYVVTVTDDNGCTSTDEVSVNVRSRPTVELSQTPEVCGDGNGSITWTIYDHPNRTGIDLSINGGANWTQIADNIGTYEFTGLAPGVYDARVRWGDNSCGEDIADVTVGADPKPAVAVTGADVLCIGGNTTLSPSFGGTWSSSNTAIASVTNSGLVTGVGLGDVTFTFTTNTGCDSDPTATITVAPDQNVIITGDNTLCQEDNTTLSASVSGGSWVSSNTAVATITSSGVVSAISAGSTTISYQLGAASCGQDAQFPLTVYANPTVNYTGPTTICEGSTTTVSPSTGGSWTSSNTAVAIITNAGVITGIAPGTATFTYTQGGTDCVSNATAQLTVVDGVEAAIDFNGSNCLEDDSQLTALPTGGLAPYTYSWSGPSGFVANTETVDIVLNGNYFVTITDNLGCTASTSGFVYEQFEAFVINLTTDVCEGESVSITASGSAGVSYQWSANAGSSTDPSITVTPSPPSTTYTVTITNNVGCTAEASATINVNTVPPLSVSGNSQICVGGTTTVSPSTGGVWSTANTDIVNVSFTGVVTGLAPGTAYLTFTDINNGCESNESLEIVVSEEVDPVFSGPTSICIGSTTNVTPATGGTWSSSNTSVATVDDAGVVTAVGPGSASFTYTDTATGCSNTTTQNLVVNGRPNVSVNATAPLCIGEFTTATPSTAGSWSSSNPAIASITNNGLVTAVSPGTVTFTFQSTITGCVSNPTAVLTVADRPAAGISGDASICVNETTSLSPAVGGTWSSENPNIATVNNFGIVTGVQTGAVRFRFTSAATGCVSAYTGFVNVEPSPVAQIVGNANICEGGTAQLSPTTGGSWVSNNPSVASVTDAGVVSGLQSGSVSFTFTDSTTGCSATTPGSITIFGQPDIQLEGPTAICQGTSTTFQPSIGGVWSSSNSSIATISLTGVATGISPGTVTFTYTETASGCASAESVTIAVEAAPAVSITGSNSLCPGETTTLSPSTGGSWLSTNPNVASVTNGGVVTGISQGLVRFTFISDAGCTSNQTTPIIVYSNPALVSVDGTTTCNGNSINILPNTGGTWQSSNANIATITDAGVITGVSEGTVLFTFTETGTGCSAVSAPYTITDLPTVNISGDANICVGELTNLAPTVGGVWTSNNPSVAAIENNGTVVGLQAGKATFTFTDVATGCESLPSDTITVLAAPMVNIVGAAEACVGETLSLSPTSGGTWTSTNPLVASVANDGTVTALAQGSVRFRFTSTVSGCPSELTAPITVNQPPTVGLLGSPFVCVGSTTTVSPTTGGSWASSDDNIATVNNSGVVTGIADGTVNLTYTDASTGCTSIALLEVTVTEAVELQITGDTEICIGSATILSPAYGGTWFSNNPMIATVTNDGIVRGVAPGEVTFTFLESTSGCTIGNVTDPVAVSSCTNPDFNVMQSGATITSSLATNDNTPLGTIYQNSVTVVSKPNASLPVLMVNADGTYTFTATVPGKYIYGVPVCIPPATYGCKSVLLEITVLDNIFSVNNVVGNPEMAYTTADTDETLLGQTVIIEAMANDNCVKVAGCSLDPTTVSVVDTPSHGTTSVSAAGDITYTPVAGFVGVDTLIYEVCDATDGLSCQQTRQLITVGHHTAANSVYAADDFTWTMRGIAQSGNVLANDGDPEGDNVTVQAVGSAASPVTVTGGSYYIDSNGDYTFLPEDSYVGYTEIVYTVCDSNTLQMCTNATLHILVFDDLTLELSLYLEGALMNNGGATGPDGKPLMRDNLRQSPFDGLNHIPTVDPYTYSTGSFDFTSKYTKVGPGLRSENISIVDSAGVFGVTGHNAIVDWVFVEIRDKDNVLNTLGTRSGLLQRDGDVVDVDGVSPLRFNGINADSFYVVVNHKSHLGAMSTVVPNGQPIDFRSVDTEVFDYGTNYLPSIDFTGFATNKSVKPGYSALWAGDFDSNGLIKFDNPNDDQNILFFTITTFPGNTLANSNYDFGYGYYSCDYDMNGKVKYDNPNDDNNMLFFQIIACSLNEIGLSNFNFFIEQVPR